MESLKSRAMLEIEKLPETEVEMVAKQEVVAIVIEPSSEEILDMVAQFRLGKSNVEVQRLVRRQDKEDFLCFSLEQIETVRQALSEVISNKSSHLVLEEGKVEGKVEELVR